MARLLKLAGAGLSFLASLFCFGVGCNGAGANRNWLSSLDSPGRAVERFGQCVVDIDRTIDTPDGPIAMPLMALFLLISIALTVSAIRQRRPDAAS